MFFASICFFESRLLLQSMKCRCWPWWDLCRPGRHQLYTGILQTAQVTTAQPHPATHRLRLPLLESVTFPPFSPSGPDHHHDPFQPPLLSAESAAQTSQIPYLPTHSHPHTNSPSTVSPMATMTPLVPNTATAPLNSKCAPRWPQGIGWYYLGIACTIICSLYGYMCTVWHYPDIWYH